LLMKMDLKFMVSLNEFDDEYIYILFN
jgi:hypothetical protein